MQDQIPGKPLRVYAVDGSFSDFSTDDLVGRKLNFFEGWSCGAGVENLCVDMDGNVFRATCRMAGKLGNIYQDFEVPKEWIRCYKDVCSCGADLFIPKVKSFENKELLLKTAGLQPNLQLRAVDDLKHEQMVATERIHASNRKQVYWEIGRRCNYNCSYCLPDIHNKTDRHKTLAELIEATNKVITKFADGSSVNFIISGGEPTMNPDFLDWTRYISTMGHYLSMHSNGSRLPKYYRELIHYGDLNLSMHFEFFDLEKFVAVVAEIVDEKVKSKNVGVGHLEVKLMMAPGRRQEALRARDLLLQIPDFKDWCTWAFVPIRDLWSTNHVTAGYEAEDYKLFGAGI